MQILVTSDTHLSDPSELPPELINVANSSEMILHAGDFISSDIHDFLDGLGNLIAVRGNSDEAALRGRLPLKQVVEINGVKIGLIHGSGTPFGMARRSVMEFPEAQAVVYGHAHKPNKEMIGDVLVINPGSPTANRFQSKNTYGLLIIHQGSVRGKIVELPAKVSAS